MKNHLLTFALAVLVVVAGVNLRQRVLGIGGDPPPLPPGTVSIGGDPPPLPPDVLTAHAH